MPWQANAVKICGETFDLNLRILDKRNKHKNCPIGFSIYNHEEYVIKFTYRT